MKSQATRRFWKQLPADVQRLAVNFGARILRTVLSGSGGFKAKLTWSPYEIGDHYRALGEFESDAVTWVWIRTHAEYDRLTG